MKGFRGVCELVIILMVVSMLVGCGESTATVKPAPTATQVAAMATTVVPTTVSGKQDTPETVVTTPLNATGEPVTAIESTRAATSYVVLPPFLTNKELADNFKSGANVEEIAVDPALLEACKAYFSFDQDLIVKLFVFSGKANPGFGFDTLKRGYVPADIKLSNDVTGSIFDIVFEQVEFKDTPRGDLPQMAIYQGGLFGETIQQSVEVLNRFSQNRLGTQKLLAQVQGKDSVELIVFGKKLVDSIQSKRVPEPTLTPIPAVAIRPSGTPVVIKGREPFDGELRVFQLVRDSSRSYTSIRYRLEAPDEDGQATSTMNYTAVRPRFNSAIDQELDVEWVSDTFTDRVIIVGGKRYENSRGEGWVEGEYQGASEGDNAMWGKAFAEIITGSLDLTGYNFTLLPDEKFKGQTVGHFKVEGPDEGERKFEVRYNKETYKPVQVIYFFSTRATYGFTIDYEYNNPSWKIVEPSKLPPTTPIPTTVRVMKPTATSAPTTTAVPTK